MIFPEGATSNGECLIKFKAGAFASLMPVKPYINRASTLVGNTALGSLMNMWHYSFLIPFSAICYWPECLEMPVFSPNKYFWNKYWDGKDEATKWKVYA